MKTAFRARYWDELTGRPDEQPIQGATFGRRYLAALLGVPMPTNATPATSTPVRRKAFFGPLAAAALSAVVLLLGTWALSPAPATLPNYVVEPVQVGATNVVILVDESGSMSQEDMKRERQAASVIAHSVLSDKSYVSVIGFGSADDPGTSPVDIVCPMTALAHAGTREAISTCIARLQRRGAGADGTDHASALRAALDQIGRVDVGSGARLIFLLTDGKLDVTASPSWGPTAAQRTFAAQAALDEMTRTARAQGVQIWPIGFGNADANALDELATGGYQGSCGKDGQQPKATVVASAADVIEAAAKASSASQCASQQKPPGRELELSVEMPRAANTMSIIVTKADASATVTFVDPSGHVIPPPQTDGELGPIESILVTAPMPGIWRVKISSATAQVEPLATLTATWTT
ncbi:VWA domain-containing protein [Lentzea aerocolonigenes]|uniref:VWA domain-containing protein n=1 Tax=Lentzea aerocolonigenes TaxID=68170 RepID=UPI000698F6E0|nr:vWA domain-containing protein [Lentzea aerocolonigenes]